MPHHRRNSILKQPLESAESEENEQKGRRVSFSRRKTIQHFDEENNKFADTLLHERVSEISGSTDGSKMSISVMSTPAHVPENQQIGQMALFLEQPSISETAGVFDEHSMYAEKTQMLFEDIFDDKENVKEYTDTQLNNTEDLHNFLRNKPHDDDLNHTARTIKTMDISDYRESSAQDCTMQLFSSSLCASNQTQIMNQSAKNTSMNFETTAALFSLNPLQSFNVDLETDRAVLFSEKTTALVTKEANENSEMLQKTVSMEISSYSHATESTNITRCDNITESIYACGAAKVPMQNFEINNSKMDVDIIPDETTTLFLLNEQNNKQGAISSTTTDSDGLKSTTEMNLTIEKTSSVAKTQTTPCIVGIPKTNLRTRLQDSPKAVSYKKSKILTPKGCRYEDVDMSQRDGSKSSKLHNVSMGDMEILPSETKIDTQFAAEKEDSIIISSTTLGKLFGKKLDFANKMHNVSLVEKLNSTISALNSSKILSGTRNRSSFSFQVSQSTIEDATNFSILSEKALPQAVAEKQIVVSEAAIMSNRENTDISKCADTSQALEQSVISISREIDALSLISAESNTSFKGSIDNEESDLSEDLSWNQRFEVKALQKLSTSNLIEHMREFAEAFKQAIKIEGLLVPLMQRRTKIKHEVKQKVDEREVAKVVLRAKLNDIIGGH